MGAAARHLRPLRCRWDDAPRRQHQQVHRGDRDRVGEGGSLRRQLLVGAVRPQAGLLRGHRPPPMTTHSSSASSAAVTTSTSATASPCSSRTCPRSTRPCSGQPLAGLASAGRRSAGGTPITPTQNPATVQLIALLLQRVVPARHAWALRHEPRHDGYISLAPDGGLLCTAATVKPKRPGPVRGPTSRRPPQQGRAPSPSSTSSTRASPGRAIRARPHGRPAPHRRHLRHPARFPKPPGRVLRWDWPSPSLSGPPHGFVPLLLRARKASASIPLMLRGRTIADTLQGECALRLFASRSQSARLRRWGSPLPGRHPSSMLGRRGKTASSTRPRRRTPEALERGGLDRAATLECWVRLGAARAVLGNKSAALTERLPAPRSSSVTTPSTCQPKQARRPSRSRRPQADDQSNRVHCASCTSRSACRRSRVRARPSP